MPPHASLALSVYHRSVLCSPLRTSPLWASLVAQLLKNPPVMWETGVQSLGWEDPLEKGWNNRLDPNRKRSMSRLYIVTLLI